MEAEGKGYGGREGGGEGGRVIDHHRPPFSPSPDTPSHPPPTHSTKGGGGVIRELWHWHLQGTVLVAFSTKDFTTLLRIFSKSLFFFSFVFF